MNLLQKQCWFFYILIKNYQLLSFQKWFWAYNYYKNQLYIQVLKNNYRTNQKSIFSLIAIDSTCSISKAFSIFESINSKGKPLDEIDKIKTYIFSKLDESSYDYYLDLWGKLIVETNDQLYDYLYNYVKAYISFYRQNILTISITYC